MDGEGTKCGDPEMDCKYGVSCSANGKCVPGEWKEDGTLCGDKNGDDCNLPNKCLHGECVTNFFQPMGMPCGEESSNDCVSLFVVLNVYDVSQVE
jgi:hypothetical protein